MSPYRPIGIAGIAMTLVLTGCSSTPTVDLAAAQDWLDSVVAAESDGPGFAGAATMAIGPATGEAAGEGVRLDYPVPTQVVRLDARCYGGDDGGVTARVVVTASPADGSTAPAVTTEIPCDREPHGIDVDTGPADAIAVGATANTDTYLHLTLIQELVVER